MKNENQTYDALGLAVGPVGGGVCLDVFLGIYNPCIFVFWHDICVRIVYAVHACRIGGQCGAVLDVCS